VDSLWTRRLSELHARTEVNRRTLRRPQAPGLLPRPRSLRTPDAGACSHENSRLRQAQRRRSGQTVIAAIALGAAAASPLVILGLVALLRAKREDIPAIVQALSRWGRR
jgi:hypothetical protein